MKDILIIFCVLLLVLLVLSALGGSVRPAKESFPDMVLPNWEMALQQAQNPEKEKFTFESIATEEPERVDVVQDTEHYEEVVDNSVGIAAFDNVDTFASF